MDIRPTRTRKQSLLVRLNDTERQMLDDLAEALDMPSISEAFRFLVRTAHAEKFPKKKRSR